LNLERILENLKYLRKTWYLPLKGRKRMFGAKLRTSLSPVIVFWLSNELKKEIPELDLYGLERRLLDFASKDLEIWFSVKRDEANFDEIEKNQNVKDNQEEIKAFLKIWTHQWLEKWRERVTLCQKMPIFSIKHIKRKKRAKNIFEHMEKGPELKKLLIRKLVNQGEVCMPELIAQNFVIEQIANHLINLTDKDSVNKTLIQPWKILNGVLYHVNSLTKRKKPLIHMRLMIDS
jgi:hypothetical protein